MKRILIFLLLIVALCITSCSNGNTTTGADEAPVGGITPSAEASTEAAESSPEDPHKGWTWLLGDVYIPDLPFNDWEGGNQDNISCFTIYIKSYNSAAFHAYAQSLTDFGYTIEQTESYAYSGTDPENRSIHLTDHENGQMQISIYY